MVARPGDGPRGEERCELRHERPGGDRSDTVRRDRPPGPGAMRWRGGLGPVRALKHGRPRPERFHRLVLGSPLTDAAAPDRRTAPKLIRRTVIDEFGARRTEDMWLASTTSAAWRASLRSRRNQTSRRSTPTGRRTASRATAAAS